MMWRSEYNDAYETCERTAFELRIKSLDSRRHVEWLLDRLETRASALHALQAAPGVQMWSRCIWWSKYSEGGPILWPEHMTRLAALGLGLRYEIVFSGTTF